MIDCATYFRIYFHITDYQGNVRQVWDTTSDTVVQENHYYPYGSMFGESASVEHQNILSHTSDNAYRYSGKEWLTHGGLNHYDFAARLYDPSLGRFNRPDPLNSDYPHLSSYLYCTGNPINATDPTGMAVIFNSDGVYLEKSVEGFTGGILVYKREQSDLEDAPIYNSLRGNGYSLCDFTEAYLREHLTPYEEANLSISAQVSIWNTVIGHFEGMQVYDETFSMDRIAGGKIMYLNELKHSNTSWATAFIDIDGNMFDRPKLYGTGLFADGYEATVENLASSIIVHEYYSHGLKHYSDISKNHQLAYMNVIGFESFWQKTTDRYKYFNFKTLGEYIFKETLVPLVKNK